MSAADAGYEVIADEIGPKEVTLRSGLVVQMARLKTRQFFRLLRVMTKGAPEMLPALAMSKDGDTDEFVTQMMAIMFIAIPEAEEHSITFIKSMVLHDGDVQHNAKLDLELDNPELEDLVSLFEAIFQQEAGDMLALGKRLQTMFKMAEKMGATDSTSKEAKAGDTKGQK